MSVKLKSWMPVREVLKGSAEPSMPAARSDGRGEVHAMTGNDAAAYALKQIDPHVAAAYPITPQTELMHKFAEYVARGQVRTDMVTVESEHSAMTATLSAASAGTRAFTATCANGLAYMIEVYTNAGGLRQPLLLVLVNRHVGGLLNIHNDHSDAMLARNAPWIQIHGENAQEAYDTMVQAYRIAEDSRVRLPITVCYDGFIVSHTVERLLTLSDAEVKDFVGEYVPPVDLLDVDNPKAVGPLVLPDYTPNFYAQISEAMRWAPTVIQEVGQEYGKLSGRPYGLIEGYRMEDAEVAIVAMGSTCGTVRAVVDALRSEGVKAGLLKVRVFRPFPAEAIGKALCNRNLKAVTVIDKMVEIGSGGPLFNEVMAGLAIEANRDGGRMPAVTNAIMGIGGRDITLADINGIYVELTKIAKTGKQPAGDPVRFIDTGDTGENIMDLPQTRLGKERASSTCNMVMMARGGQGAKTASYLLTQLMIDLGKFAQGFPTYGPERTGAPIKAFAKISDHPVDDRQQIYAPDVTAVFDETLIDPFKKDFHNMAPNGVLLVNTSKAPAEIRKQIGLEGRRIYTVDATGIAVEEFGANRPNTAMMAALIGVLKLCDIEAFKAAFKGKMKRLSEKVLQGNLRAIDRAVATVKGENQ
jgi:pyruvate ferredoxin oxidoreductase alpha subunit